MHATSDSIQFDAYANQILQLVLEVNNIGQCPVEKLVVCTNWPEQGLIVYLIFQLLLNVFSFC